MPNFIEKLFAYIYVLRHVVFLIFTRTLILGVFLVYLKSWLSGY